MEVKTNFLHGALEEDIYIKQPNGFNVKGKEDHMCRLRKSLYELKKAPRQWYNHYYKYTHFTSDAMRILTRIGKLGNKGRHENLPP